jgi:hypothetical protein
VVLLVGTPPEGVIAMARALGGAGVKAETPPLGAIDEGKAKEIAGRSQAGAAMLLSGQVTDEGPVRGTTRNSASCRLAARVLPVSSAPTVDRTAEARAFAEGAAAASAECLARVAGDLTRQTSASLSPAVAVPRDMRLVTLDLDVIEPAALPLVMQALKKVGSVSASEVRRVTVGHVELRTTTRLSAPSLVAAIARELTGTATVTAGQPAADRVPLQVRLAAPAAPAPPTP